MAPTRRSRASRVVAVALVASLSVQVCVAFLAASPALARGGEWARLGRSGGSASASSTRVEMVAAEAAAVQKQLETLKFLNPETVRATKAAVGTPAYVYDAASLKANAEACLAFPNAYGLTVRYAMKSLPNKAVLQLFQG
ncbi:unnamed protein product [Ectocarpus sp. 4 AP-2014]